MAAAFPAMMMAGAAMSAVGAIQQGQAQAQAANYNANLAERNARVVAQQTTAEVGLQRQEAARTQGSLIAGYAASGVTMEGSPSDVLRASITQAKLDEHTLIYKGDLQAMGLRETATLNRFQGQTAENQSYLNAASYLVGGAGQAGFASARMDKASREDIGLLKAET